MVMYRNIQSVEPNSSNNQPSDLPRITHKNFAMERQPALPIFLLLVTCFLSCAVAGRNKKPNILFVLMDDLGFGDIGFADNRFHTPVIDALRNSDSAIRFNRSYTPPNCGPSRAALLSGIYPWRMGLQGNAINSGSSAAIPLDKTLLPQALKKIGYQTHLVGKWHQGFCKKAQTPTRRGFDSFFGFYLTKQDYFSHFTKKDGYDFRSDLLVNRSVQGNYSTYIYSERVRQLIREYKDSLDSRPGKTKPFFILLSHAAIHGPNQVPDHYINHYCTKIDAKDKLRRQKCGMMAAVDEGLRNITDDLKAQGLMDNLLIVFTSDDGGKVDEGSSNFPLRGAKRTLWDGGIRVHTFLHSEDRKVLPKRGFTYKGLFYNTDFYSTLLGIATDSTGDSSSDPQDSFNQWKHIKEGKRKDSSRERIVYIEEDREQSMLIEGNMKLLRYNDRNPDWYNRPPGAKRPRPSEDLDKISKYQLFDLETDPMEAKNLIDRRPRMRKVMADYLRTERKNAPKPWPREDLSSDPRKYGYVWSSGWC